MDKNNLLSQIRRIMPSKTIDNLGPEAHKHYAENIEFQEKDPVENWSRGRSISLQTTIDVVEPFLSSEIDQLITSPHYHLPLALFSSPPGYFMQKKALFSHWLIPSLGGTERKEADLTRIKNYEPEPAEKQNKNILSKFLKIFLDLEEDLLYTYSEISRYQKG
jgi:hypothetical protein